jgi:hypothetical protein
VAPRIPQHVIEIRSAHRYFGARQVRSHFGRNAPQLRIEPQAGFPATQEPLLPEAPLGTVARQLRTFCGSRSPDWRPPPHPAADHRSDFPRERTAWCGGELHALRLDPSGEVIHLFPRFSREQRVLDLPSLSAAPRSAAHPQLRLSKAEADATCEHQRNRAGEAVLSGLHLGAADSRLNFGYLMC